MYPKAFVFIKMLINLCYLWIITIFIRLPLATIKWCSRPQSPKWILKVPYVAFLEDCVQNQPPSLQGFQSIRFILTRAIFIIPLIPEILNRHSLVCDFWPSPPMFLT